MHETFQVRNISRKSDPKISNAQCQTELIVQHPHSTFNMPFRNAFECLATRFDIMYLCHKHIVRAYNICMHTVEFPSDIAQYLRILEKF